MSSVEIDQSETRFLAETWFLAMIGQDESSLTPLARGKTVHVGGYHMARMVIFQKQGIFEKPGFLR
jgi:hypothetical protein